MRVPIAGLGARRVHESQPRKRIPVTLVSLAIDSAGTDGHDSVSVVDAAVDRDGAVTADRHRILLILEFD